CLTRGGAQKAQAVTPAKSRAADAAQTPAARSATCARRPHLVDALPPRERAVNPPLRGGSGRSPLTARSRGGTCRVGGGGGAEGRSLLLRAIRAPRRLDRSGGAARLCLDTRPPL